MVHYFRVILAIYEGGQGLVLFRAVSQKSSPGACNNISTFSIYTLMLFSLGLVTVDLFIHLIKVCLLFSWECNVSNTHMALAVNGTDSWL